MDVKSRWNLVRIVLTSMHLFVGWLLFTWSLQPSSLVLGAVFSVLVSLITYSIFIDEQEAERRTHFPRVDLLIVFLAVLAFNMYVASFQVMWQIIRGRINPGVVHFRTRLRSDLARVALTSAITLTPGTITLNLEDDHLIVHWLSARTTHSKYAGNLVKGVYERFLRRIWI